jgi:lysophospholipase L1-like esterase
MPGKNKSAYPFYIIVGTLGCLVALSLVSNSFSYNHFTARPLDLLADIRKEAAAAKAAATADSMQMQTVDATDSATLRIEDDIQRAGMVDPDHLHDFVTYTGILNYMLPSEDTANAGLQHFLTALEELKSHKRKKVRIAYFGDSMIEGDLITEDLRDSLQQVFGGAGVGFVPITSVVAGFRTTITHTFSKDWKDYSYKQLPPNNVLLGMSGHTFMPAGSSWIRYASVRKRGLDRFNQVSVLYGPAAAGNISVNEKSYVLSGQQPVNKLALSLDSARQVTIKWAGGEAAPLYGVSFEGDTGVYVDNYSFRGISGLELGKLSGQLVQQMQQQHPYDLIVLHYGANVLWKPELTDYSWYGRPMNKVMDALRNDLPNTSFLVITTADKSYKKSGNYITAPGVTALLKVQHEMAKEHGTAYWNLYAAMGGEGSMRHWVEGDTVLANKDYTHFNRQGAAKVGALLYKAMMDEYKQLDQN